MNAEQIDLEKLLENKMGKIIPEKGAKTALKQLEMRIPKNLMYDAESIEFKPETKPVTASLAKGLTVEEAKSIDDDMNRFVDVVLIEGVDYGLIPHCPKPTLFKSGAEKILSYLGLIARTEIVNRVEDYNIAFFSYEAKVYLIDYNGIVRGEGVGVTNSKEERYSKSNGFNVQNVILKISKKRALVDATLNVGNLSARFTQDIEDLSFEHTSNRNTTGLDQKINSNRLVTPNQLKYLEQLMCKHNASIESMNKYIKVNFGVETYRDITGNQASMLIDKLKAIV